MLTVTLFQPTATEQPLVGANLIDLTGVFFLSRTDPISEKLLPPTQTILRESYHTDWRLETMQVSLVLTQRKNNHEN
jgi:hypothetical protein